MSDLSRALVDAAAEAVHARLCGCGGPVGDADEHIDTGRVAVAAVLETLAVNGSWLPDIEPGWYMTASEVNELLRRLAAEVKSEEDR